MTLQYRTRSRWEDRKWMQRVRLCNCVLTQTVDHWYRVDDPFPVVNTIACYLYLCSPRCDPLGISESGLLDFLGETTQSAEREFVLAWPSRKPSLAEPLIVSMTQALEAAVDSWETGSLVDLAIESVNEQLVQLIVEHQFVIFHHNQTTRRDGGFYGQG